MKNEKENVGSKLRCSPSLAKRARNADYNVEFDILESQEMTGERKRKRRRASIAS